MNMILNRPKRKIIQPTPEQEAISLSRVIEESHTLVKRWNTDVGVFRNEEGNYFARELKYCRSEKGAYDVRYVALVRYVKRRSAK